MSNNTEYPWEKYLKDCGQPDHFKDILLDPESGLFTGVAGDDIATVLRSASIRTFAKGEYLYTEDSPRAEVPLYVVLAGEFVVDQTIINEEVKTVAVYGPGVLLNDVGCVLVGVTRNVLDRGRDGFALASVFPKEGGVVLEIRKPIETIWNIEASRLHLNISRLLAIKLINRAVGTESKLVRQRRLVVGQIRKMIAELEPGKNHSMETSKKRPLRYNIRIRKSDVARDLRMKASTLFTECSRLKAISLPHHGVEEESFLWEGDYIQMSKPMQNVFLNHTSELLTASVRKDLKIKSRGSSA